MFDKTYGVEPGSVTPTAIPSQQPLEQKVMNASPLENAQKETSGIQAVLAEFVAYMPTHTYIHIATGAHWPAASIDGRFPIVSTDVGPMLPSKWLDKNRAVVQQVWDPAQPAIVENKVMVSAAYVSKIGERAFNRYRAPNRGAGSPDGAMPWREHLQRLYPNDYKHIESYFAFKLQHPGVKVNHAIVLGGAPGIGKDTLLEPIKHGVGPGNWQEISPAQMNGRFNGWAKTVILRISEAHHAGNKEAMSFYEQSKPLFAGPPDIIRIDEKNTPEYYVANVCGVVITTNNRTDAMYLPSDDRRHFVAWSEITREQFSVGYFDGLYQWLANGGQDDVVAYLLSKDLGDFDHKAPPPKTPAFWVMVAANEAPEATELREAIERLGSPPAVRLADLKSAAETHALVELLADLSDRKQSKSWGGRLAKVGYVFIRNPDTKDGYFCIRGKYCAVYANKNLNTAEQVRAARRLG